MSDYFLKHYRYNNYFVPNQYIITNEYIKTNYNKVMKLVGVIYFVNANEDKEKIYGHSAKNIMNAIFVKKFILTVGIISLTWELFICESFLLFTSLEGL